MADIYMYVCWGTESEGRRREGEREREILIDLYSRGGGGWLCIIETFQLETS